MQKSNTLNIDSVTMNKLVYVKQVLRGRTLCATSRSILWGNESERPENAALEVFLEGK